MITGRKIADGSNGKGKASERKTPLMAAVQATAAQTVNGTTIASQVARRWPGVRPVRSRPIHKPSAMSPWTISRTARAGRPLSRSTGSEQINHIHSTVNGTVQSRLRQAGRGGTIAAGTATMVIGGLPCEVRPYCGRSGIGHEQAERQKRTDCDVLVVHKILLGQWKALHDRLRLGNIPGIQQEHDSATIATRIPLTNLPIEIELHGLPDFGWHDGHDLFACDARLHGKDDHHPGGCGRGGLCLGNGWMGHGSSAYQS